MNELRGISLKQLGVDVRTSLENRTEDTAGAVTFKTAKDGEMALRPDKSYAASGIEDIYFDGVPAGKLAILALDRGNGTGNGKDYTLDNIDTGKYPRELFVIPRKKGTTAAEGAVSLLSYKADMDQPDPVMDALNLALIGLNTSGGMRLQQIGELGQSKSDFQKSMAGMNTPEPTTTLTVGNRFSSDPLDLGPLGRFGDPHSVYNEHPDRIQVVGFVVFDRSRASTQLLRYLDPQPPIPSTR